MRKILFKRILRNVCMTLLWCLFLQINAMANTAISSKKPFYLTTTSLTARANSTGLSFAKIDVTGVVKDTKGDPLPGVAVRVKGSQVAVSTDGDGKFTLRNLADDAVLTFTSIGYKPQEIAVKGKSNLQVVLEENTEGLNEVVVVGYGTQKKATLTGAVAQIGAEEIMKSPTPNPTNSLIGRLPGLVAVQTSGQPGADAASLKVRGVATYGTNSAAIVVVDGIERPSFADVDPSEIETVTVLKDASSTAIYGLRGANGVIVITTKAGKIGKPKITYTGNYAAQTYTGLAVGLPAFENASLLNQSYLNDGKAAPFTPAEIQKFQDGSDPIGYPDVQWFDYLTRKFYSQTQHNININGGTKIAKYFVSAGYAFQDGIFKKFDSPYGINTVPNYNRYNFRSNIDLTFNKDFTVGIKLGGRFANRYQPSGLLSSSAFSYDTIEGMISRILQVPAYAYPVTLPDGRITANPNVGTNIWNPYAVLTRFGTRNDDINTIESTFNIDYKLGFITKGLSFKTNFGFDSYYNNVERRNANWAAYVYNPVTGTTTLSTDTRNRDEPLGAVQDGGVTTGSTNMNLQSGFYYNHDFSKHNVSGLLLGTRQLIRSTGTTSFTAPPKAAQGLVGRVTYNYDERYFAEFNAAYNGSENFAPGLRYGFFPAASAGWTISNEPFWKKNNFVNYLKLRGSYGLTGNAEIANNASLGLYSAAYGYVGVPGQRATQLANPDLKWEKTAQMDLGLEFGFFNNRLSAEVDYYTKKTSDLLLNVNVPGTSGFSTLLKNVGELENKGWEFVLRTDNSFGDLKWKASVNAATNKNKILNLQGQVITGGFLNRAVEGQPLGVFFGPEYAGVDPANGDAIYYKNTTKADGSIDRSITNDVNEAEYTVIGNPNPKWIGGITNEFSYKGADFSFTFQGVYGNDVYNGAGKFMSANGEFYDNQTVDQLNRWKKPGDITMVPQARYLPDVSNGTAESSRYLQDASYTRLKTITLGYTFPKAIVNKLKLSKLRVYATANNLLTFTKYTGWDPEVNTDYLGGVAAGNDFYSAPQPKTITVGLNLGF
eukprot:GDKJ01021962.1.p1 GENE.GDKJ01021962.1~~GDKJ01021962.1.p1  ORF type:complete len:1052 (+),score=95.81 GDKJ01021962.1:1627-4782(+)